MAAVLLSLSWLGACGGEDGPSADDYRAQLDEACQILSNELTSIPQTVRDEDLTLEDADRIAAEAGLAFQDEVEALEPPEDLRETHEALLTAIAEAPPEGFDFAAARDRALELSRLFDGLGAEGCAERQQRAAQELEAARTAG